MIFLVVGLLIGIATIVALMSITDSMASDIEERLNRFGANIVMVPRNDNLSLSYGGITVGGVSYTMKELDEADLPKIRKIKNSMNIGIIAPKVLGIKKIKGKEALLMGADIEAELTLKTWWQYAGTLANSKKELILGSEAAKTLALAIGDIVELGDSQLTVAAILQSTGGQEDGIVIGDLHEIQRILGKEGKISLVEIAAFCRGCPISEMTLQIAEKFPNARVTALKQAVMAKMQSIELVKSFSYGIAGLVIFIGSLLVFVTMMGSVNERTREIGIFRAIGFRQGHVMQIMLLEAIVVGLIGGVLGYIIGSFIAWGVIPYVIKGGTFSGPDFPLGGISIILAVSLSLLASLYPAHKASRLDPSAALRAL